MKQRLKLAVVREDPRIEAVLCERLSARQALVVASGGCTALALKARFPDLAVTAFDLNPAQLAHVAHKAEAVGAGLDCFNVEDDDPGALSQCGEFEGLFRVLRGFLEEFVFGVGELESYFAGESTPASRRPLLASWRASGYWPAAFEVAFATAFLHAMFGPEATQHAPPGSYPAYFQAAFERGLARDDGARNPFLQHVLLGRYLRADAPAFIEAGRPLEVELVEGTLSDVGALERFELFSLSNVFDWSDDSLVAAWAELLGRQARAGSAILVRQLNNERSIRPFFASHFAFDDALGAELLQRDRSLFYNRIEVGFHRGAKR